MVAIRQAAALNSASSPPNFDDKFKSELLELFRWRRDVRRFLVDPVPPEVMDALIGAASYAPSVGYSQPSRFVLVKDDGLRKRVRESFTSANRNALASYAGERAELYAKLKLAGFDQAPEQMAVFCDTSTTTGNGLGQQTMPEMLEYSTVMACYTFWLVARTHRVGVGWVSILAPDEIKRILSVPDSWKLIGYFCIGYPAEEHCDPELARNGWEEYQAPQVLVR